MALPSTFPIFYKRKNNFLWRHFGVSNVKITLAFLGVLTEISLLLPANLTLVTLHLPLRPLTANRSLLTPKMALRSTFPIFDKRKKKFLWRQFGVSKVKTPLAFLGRIVLPPILCALKKLGLDTGPQRKFHLLLLVQILHTPLNEFLRGQILHTPFNSYVEHVFFVFLFVFLFVFFVSCFFNTHNHDFCMRTTHGYELILPSGINSYPAPEKYIFVTNTGLIIFACAQPMGTSWSCLLGSTRTLPPKNKDSARTKVS